MTIEIPELLSENWAPKINTAMIILDDRTNTMAEDLALLEESILQVPKAIYRGVWSPNTSGAPYMLNQVVTYNNKLWSSTIDNNASTPGADANWTSTLTDPIPTTADIKNIVKITQAAYDALSPKVATTLYVIVG